MPSTHPATARRAPVVLFTLASFLVYAGYALSRWPQYLVAGYDLGIFDQAVRQYSRFNAPFVALKGDEYHLLGDHFHPVLALLAPLYWIWDDPRTLLLAQAALVASSLPLVMGALRRHLSERMSWLFLVGYAYSWPVQKLVDFDFHEICFALPLLALALDGLDRRSDRRLLLGALPLLLVREDMGMVLAMLGLVRLADGLRGRFDRRRLWLGPALALIGTVVFVLVTKVITPHFSPTGSFAYWTYDALGPDAGSAIAFIVRHPLRTAEIFFTPWVKTATMAWLLLPLAFTPLASNRVLVVLPLLAQRFLSSRTHLWTTQFHYNAPIFLVLLFATLDVLGRLSSQRRRLVSAVVAVLMFVTPVVGAAVANTSPFVRVFWSAWRVKPHVADQAAMVARVPAGTCVEADDRLAPHLTRSNRVTLPTLTRRASDFIVIDLAQKEVGYPLPTPQKVRDDALARGYVEVAREGELLMLQRPGYAGPSAGCSPTSP